MVDETDAPEPRQRRLRPVGGNMGGLAQSSVAEGNSGLNDPDGELHVAPTAPTEVPDPTFTPSGQIEEAALSGGRSGKEYRLKLIHRSLMRRVPVHQIAQQLQISTSQVYRDIAELKKHLRLGAQDLDSDELIGDTMGYYNEIAAMSLRMASDSKRTDAARLTALRTALASRNDLNRFLQASGVLDVLRYKAQVGKNEANDMEMMVAMTESFLQMQPDDTGEFHLKDEDKQRIKDLGGLVEEDHVVQVI